MKRTLNGLGYREAQARNRNEFHKLNKFQQKGLRAKGYRNVGWDSVANSWGMLQEILTELVEIVNLPPSSLNEKRRQRIKKRLKIATERFDFDAIRAGMLELSDIAYQETLQELGI